MGSYNVADYLYTTSLVRPHHLLFPKRTHPVPFPANPNYHSDIHIAQRRSIKRVHDILNDHRRPVRVYPHGLVQLQIRGRRVVQEGMRAGEVVAVARIQVLPDPPYTVDLAVVEVESRVAVGEEHIASGIAANRHVAAKVHALVANEGCEARVWLEANVVGLFEGGKVMS